MIIAVCTNGNSEYSLIGEEFAKSQRFIVYNTDTSSYNVLENTIDEEVGTGIEVINHLQLHHVDAIIVFDIGTNACLQAQNKNIKVYRLEDKQVIVNAIRLWKENKLQECFEHMKRQVH